MSEALDWMTKAYRRVMAELKATTADRDLALARGDSAEAAHGHACARLLEVIAERDTALLRVGRLEAQLRRRASGDSPGSP